MWTVSRQKDYLISGNTLYKYTLSRATYCSKDAPQIRQEWIKCKMRRGTQDGGLSNPRHVGLFKYAAFQTQQKKFQTAGYPVPSQTAAAKFEINRQTKIDRYRDSCEKINRKKERHQTIHIRQMMGGGGKQATQHGKNKKNDPKYNGEYYNKWRPNEMGQISSSLTSKTAPYLQGLPVSGSLTSIPKQLSFAPMSFIICPIDQHKWK